MKTFAIGLALAAAIGSSGCLTGNKPVQQEYLLREKEADNKPKKPVAPMTKLDADRIDESNAKDSLKQLESELIRESGEK
jgi:hypothetical protein